MGNIFNEDFRDFLLALHRTGVRYVLVGSYSVILHGYPRTTGDLSIWAAQTAENDARLVRAFLTRSGCPRSTGRPRTSIYYISFP